MNILLIDDDQDLCFLFKAFCKKVSADISVEWQDNGAAGWEYLSSRLSSDDEIPDAVVTDLSMPQYDGFWFLDKCEGALAANRARPQVFVLTSSLRSIERDKVLGYKCVTECLLKPVSRQTIENIVRQIPG